MPVLRAWLSSCVLPWLPSFFLELHDFHHDSHIFCHEPPILYHDFRGFSMNFMICFCGPHIFCHDSPICYDDSRDFSMTLTHLLSWFSGLVPWFSRLARMILNPFIVTHALLVMTLQSLPWLSRFLPWPSSSLQWHTFFVMTFQSLAWFLKFFSWRSNSFRDSHIFCHGSSIVYHDFQGFLPRFSRLYNL